MSTRIIMHVDMDAFYASVELRRRPELRGRPVIVGGHPRGVVLSATYEARAYGVRSGMASTQAIRLAPTAIFLSPDFDAYSAVSAGIGAVFRSVTPVVEAASIDEAYLDITGARRMFGTPTEIGEHVRALVADEQQISCSVGIGPTKFVAKIASKQAKPDGLIEVSRDQVDGFLHPLPVEAMWGVGAKTAERLHHLGISTIGDLAHTPHSGLRRTFGPHAGGSLRELAWGRDGRSVVVTEPERSIGSQETFGADSNDVDVVRRELLRMADKTAGRVRRAGLVGRTVTISLRFADFAELTRSVTLLSPTDVTDQIYAAAWGLYDRLGLDRARIRRVGVRVEGLVPVERAWLQPTLIEPQRGWRDADQAVDAAVARFGPGAVQRAVLAQRMRRPPAPNWQPRRIAPDSSGGVGFTGDGPDDAN
ncbi:MAG: DNA polymerase IV [Microlunatus sp.]|nr:DNA polymerase IV [Microlunatus sp.]MDN5770679.1 DNA polymerase IV [Microlunatus sp.]